MSNEFLHTGRDCIEGIPPGTISAAFVLWATQLDQVRVHSDEFATGTVRRVVVSKHSYLYLFNPPSCESLKPCFSPRLVQVTPLDNQGNSLCIVIFTHNLTPARMVVPRSALESQALSTLLGCGAAG